MQSWGAPCVEKSLKPTKEGPLHCVITPFGPAVQVIGTARWEKRMARTNIKVARQGFREMAGGRILAAAMLAIGLGTTTADAQTYPSKPIKVIVPYTPGSPVDVLARVVTQQVSARLGQSIVIDNRPGAGTTIGTKVAATAEPDGYTLLIGATSFILSFSLYQ